MTSSYYTSREAQTYLRIGKTRLFELIKTGQLTPFKLGGRLRFEGTDLRAYVDRERQGTAAA